METGFMNRMIGLVLALVVGGLLVGGLLIPSIEGMTATEKTFTNTGYFRMATLEDDDSVILEWDSSEPTKIKTNNTLVDVGASLGSYQSRSIAFAENYLIRMANNGGNSYGIQIWSSGYAIGANSDTAQIVTITIGNGTITWETTESETDTTFSYTGDMQYINPAGSNIMKKSTDEAYLLHTSSIIYAGGISTITAPDTFAGIYLEGTVDDITVTPMNNNVAVGEVTVNYTDVAGYEDLVKFDKITFPTTYNDNVVNQTYNYVVVPYQVTAELSQHLDATQIAMFGVISILGIVALVVVAANGIRNKY